MRTYAKHKVDHKKVSCQLSLFGCSTTFQQAPSLGKSKVNGKKPERKKR